MAATALHLLTRRTARGLFAVALMSAAAAIAAMGARALLQPWLGEELAFVFAFPAVAITAVWAGLLPALGTALLCGAWYLSPDLPPAPARNGGVLDALLFFVPAALMAVVITGRRHPGGEAVDLGEPAVDLGEADRSTLYWLRAGVVLSVLVPWAVFAVVAMYGHQAASANALRRVERLAAIGHEHALKLFQTSELLLRQVNTLTMDMTGKQLREEQERLHRQLAGAARGMGQVQSIWVVDAQGRTAVSSRTATLAPEVSVADWPFFSAHQAKPGSVLLYPPRKGPVTGEVFFALSQRRDTATGEFNGATVVALHPSYFTAFYRDLTDSEPGVVITLLHSERQLIARWPDGAQPGSPLAPGSPMTGVIERGETRGTVQGRSSYDGMQRIGAFRKVGDYPVYVYAGADASAAFAGWRREMLALAGFILPLSVGLALISLMAVRRTRRHMEAAAQLRREAQERQRVEAALRQSQKLEAMGHLTGGVAHDFNNLLMVVNLNVSLLRRRVGAENAGQLDAIERSVAAGKKLTRQLLAFSRRQPLVPTVLDLAEKMPSLIDLIRPALGSQIALEEEVEPGTRPVLLDSGELELALINLAVNAKAAMPDGGYARVRVYNVDDFVEIAFSDTGEGIPPENLERVFEPFFTTKPVGQGTGLGLSQVYGLCARAGGSARIESEVGKGTTVFLRFPAVEAPAVKEEAHAQPKAEARLDLRLLLVEDNLDVAFATRELLQAAGCRVVHAASPAEALEVLETGGKFDVVLTDIVMPGGMDGLQLTDELRKRYPALPVVLMTGYANKLGEAESAGWVVLPKPFEPELLLRTLREQVSAGARGAAPPAP